MNKPFWLGGAAISLLAGTTLAWHHPLWPGPVLLLFGLGCLLAAWRRGGWLFALPALLPLLNFSPWTGWLVIEEFDLLLLATLAGGYYRLAGPAAAADVESATGVASLVLQRWLLLLGLVGLLGLVRGLLDAGTVSMHWFDGYADAANSLRVFKSLGFALLLSPLLQHDLQHDAARAARWLAAGMVAGLGLVASAALWERAAFPGVFDFSTHYRSVALFWEMHVGGAALDAYLALSSPFAVWAPFYPKSSGIFSWPRQHRPTPLPCNASTTGKRPPPTRSFSRSRWAAAWSRTTPGSRPSTRCGAWPPT